MTKTKIDREKMKKDLLKRIWHGFAYQGLNSITEIEAFIHRTNFSGYYNFPELNEKIGPLKEDERYAFDPTKNNYQKKYIRRYNGFYINVLVNPKDSHLPFCYVSIFPNEAASNKEYREFLIWLSGNLPALTVSKVEYAIDIFCEDSTGVEYLFDDVIMRTLRTKYIRYVNPVESPTAVELGSSQNACVKLGDDITIYERGGDKKKQGDYWNKEDCNRVRLEYKAKSKVLKKHGINSIVDFAANPRFREINDGKWTFSQFHKSRKLPKPFEGMWEGIFESHRINEKESIKNINQYISRTPPEELKQLQLDIDSAIRGFKWNNLFLSKT